MRKTIFADSSFSTVPEEKLLQLFPWLESPWTVQGSTRKSWKNNIFLFHSSNDSLYWISAPLENERAFSLVKENSKPNPLSVLNIVEAF